MYQTLLVSITLLALFAACTGTGTNTSVTSTIGATSTPSPTYTPTYTPTFPGSAATPDPLADALKVTVEAAPSSWKEGNEDWNFRPVWALPFNSGFPTPSPADPAITFTIRAKNISDSYFHLVHGGHYLGAGLYDLKIFSEDGTLVWWLFIVRSIAGVAATTFSPGEEKSFEFQWEIKIFYPKGTPPKSVHDCPEKTVWKAPPGMYKAIGAIEFSLGPNADLREDRRIESEPVTFEITS